MLACSAEPRAKPVIRAGEKLKLLEALSTQSQFAGILLFAD